jgi:hypothetical protein
MPASTRSILRLVLPALAVLLPGVLGGCVTALDRNRVTLETLHAQGRYAEAARMLDDPNVKESYAPNSKLLYWLDRGALALALNDQATTMALLEKAEDYTESQRQPTGGEQLAQWLINDSVTNYYAEPYEEVYVNVLKMLAQLEAGKIEDGALIEARRAAGKADVLRDRYLRASTAVQERGGAQLRSSLGSVPRGAMGGAEANPSGEFLESTLGTYLSAVAFMKGGDPASQAVAGRRLISSIQLQQGLQAGVETAAFDGLGELAPDTANVLLVGLSGRAPHKVANRVGPIPVYEWPVYFELPELVGGSEEVASVRAVVTPETPGTVLAPFQLAKVEDLRAVATENHKRHLPLIYARTILRSQLKAAAMFAATEGVKYSQRRGSSRDLAQIGMILGGLAFVGLTEHADLRCWTFLPGRADVALVKLPPGRYTARVEYLGAGGGVVYTSPPRTIEVPAAGGGGTGLVTIVEHYWR